MMAGHASGNTHVARLRSDIGASVVLMLLLAATPLALRSPYWLGVLGIGLYFVMVTAGWDLLAGRAGQFSLAPAPFAMLGAYSVGLLATNFGWPLWAGLLAAVLVPCAVGLLLGGIVLRLEGVYLALTTLAFGEVLRVVALNWNSVTRGSEGLAVPTLTQSPVGYYYIFWGFLALVILINYALLRGRTGRFLEALHDDPVGAASRGINVVRYKLVAFAWSCAICGLAGGLYATSLQLVSPDMGSIQQTGIIMAMAVIGGMGSLTGAIIGGIAVYATSQLLRDVGSLQMVFFAALVIVFARFIQMGVWGVVRRALFHRFGAARASLSARPGRPS